MAYRILVASYTDAVVCLTFDPEEPSLSLSSSLTVGPHPSWLTHHPSDPTIVFTGLEQPDGRLLTLKYDLETGKGAVIGDVHSGGQDPCTILATDYEVFAGNYSSGTVGVLTLPSSPSSSSYELTTTQPALQFSGTGPNTSRQESSHPHHVYLHTSSSPLGQHEVLVPDLGADKTRRLSRNADGVWEHSGDVSYDENLGGGPRHVAVHDNILYTVLELTSTLVAHTLPPLPSSPSSSAAPPVLLASSSTLIPPPPTSTAPPETLAAEILIPSPNTSFPTTYIYISNRNEPHPEGDTIAIFEPFAPSALPAPSGAPVAQLTHVASHRTGLTHLRGVIFFGPDDRFLVAGGQNGGGVKVFERVDGGRGLREIAHLPVEDGAAPDGLQPTGFLCL